MTLDQLASQHLTDILITQDFCDYRDELILKFRDGGRDMKKRRKNGDCLLVEYELLRNELVNVPTHMAHDFQYKDMKIDAKVVDGSWFTIYADKVDWYSHSIAAGNVTHFAFYRFTKAHSKPLIVGDVVSLRFIKLVEANQVMYNRRKSQYNGFYCDIEGLPNAERTRRSTDDQRINQSSRRVRSCSEKEGFGLPKPKQQRSPSYALPAWHRLDS